MKLFRRSDVESAHQSVAFRPTAAELEWWADARQPFRRRGMAISVAVYTGLIATQLLLGDSAGNLADRWTFLVPSYLAIVSGASWLSWRLQESWLRPRMIFGKRVRDELLDGAAGD